MWSKATRRTARAPSPIPTNAAVAAQPLASAPRVASTPAASTPPAATQAMRGTGAAPQRTARRAPWRPARGRWAPAAAVAHAMRPGQWSKNGLVLVAVVFAGRLNDIAALERGVVAFLAFCFISSTVYILNDIADRASDRKHPRKRLRPIASGQLSVPIALLAAALCALVGGALAVVVVQQQLGGGLDPFARWGGSRLLFALALVSYLGIHVAYSVWLKHLVLWDVFVIAAGFVLRAMAGAFAAMVPISPWFYLCTTFLALVLALGKRRAELIQLSDLAASHRANLSAYSVPLLDQLMMVGVTCTLITYSLYTFEGGTGNHMLVVSVPFVIFGMFRYLYLLYVRDEGDRPDALLWRDPQLFAVVVLCVGVVIAVLYGVPHLTQVAL